jgi:ribosomal protein L11 methyltransferase
VTVTVPRRAVEDVLDRLLPIVPGGVREVSTGRHVELRMRGPDIPDRDALALAVGRWPFRLSEREVPDDWRERRIWDYEPDVIGGRVSVRPEWAPAPAAGLIDMPIAFADLGCGSGVQAILAARLDWSPVIAVDVLAECVSAALGNAEAAGVQIEARVMNLAHEAPPTTDGFAANLPAAVHELIGNTLPEPVPRVGVVSGFGGDEEAAVVAAYARRGMRERQSRRVHGWSVLVLDRD